MRRGHSGKSNRAVDPSSLSGFGHGTADIAESKKGSEPAAVAGVCDAEVRRDDLSTILASRLGKVCKCQVGVHCAPATLGRYRRCFRSLSDSTENRRQIRLSGPIFAAFSGSSSTIARRNRQELSTPRRIFASIVHVRQVSSPFLAKATSPQVARFGGESVMVHWLTRSAREGGR